MFKNLKITKKLTLIFLAIVFGITVVFILINQTIQIRHAEEMAAQSINYARLSFQEIEERDTEILSSALEVIIQDPVIKEIYLENDREKLYEYTLPLFQNLKNKYGITHWYFITPEGNVFLRAHSKDIYGDLVKRTTFEKAKETLEAGSGIELGLTAYALRVVMPYYGNDGLIGYMELGEEIDHFLDIFKGKIDGEFAIIADKENLDRAAWASVRQIAGLRDNWDDLNDHLIIESTFESKATKECFTEDNLERVEKGEFVFQQIQDNGKFFRCGGFVFDDAGGKHSGAILSLINITDQILSTQKSNRNTFIFSIIAFLMISLISIFISRSITGPLNKLAETAQAIAEGNINKRVKINSKDEIGTLATSFNLMADNLIRAKELPENIIRSMQEGLLILTPQAKIEKVNREVLDLLGYKNEELIGQPIEKIFSGTKTTNIKIQEVIDRFPEEVLLISKDLRILKANQSFFTTLGLTENEVAGRYCYKITHNLDEPCKPPRDICPISEITKTGNLSVETHIHLDKNKKEIIVNVVAAPIKDRRGNIIGYLHFSKVVKEGEKKEEALADALKIAENIKSDLSGAMPLIIAETVFKGVNLDNLMKGITIKDQPIMLAAKNGEEIPVALSTSAIKDELGNVMSIVVVAEDLREIIATEKEKRDLLEKYAEKLEFEVKQRTSELSQTSSKLLSLVESVKLGVIMVDLNYKIITINQAAREILGKSSDEEVIIKDLEGKIEGIDLSKSLTSYVKDNKPFSIEEVKIDERYFRLFLSPVRDITEKIFIGSVIIFEEITDQKIIDRMRTEIISTTSHQLRTPLSVIKGNLEMVLEGDVGKVNAEQKEILGEAFLGSERMIKLVNDLMDISKIDEGRFELSPKPTSLEDLVGASVKELQSFADGKHVKLSYVPPLAPLPQVNVDNQRVKQVLMNLIDNAVKYSKIDHKGEVNVEVKKDLLGNFVKVTIKDNGVGIPKDEQRKLFDRFFRASNASKLDPGGGTGLGLYIARAIVEQSNGKIWFESEGRDKGTTFCFTLPALKV